MKELDFSGFKEERIKNEAKYYILFSLKNKHLSGTTVFKNRTKELFWIGNYISGHFECSSLEGLEIPEEGLRRYLEGKAILSTQKADPMQFYRELASSLVGFLTAYYDERDEREKDIWSARNIPGASQIHIIEVQVMYRKVNWQMEQPQLLQEETV